MQGIAGKCRKLSENQKIARRNKRCGNSTFPNACGEALLAKREFMARAEGEKKFFDGKFTFMSFQIF